MNTPLSLVISHNIFLTSEEIKTLVGGESIIIIGTCVPVWFDKGFTSEPATEVFCEYRLKNDNEKACLITKNKKGFSINLPQIPKGYEEPKKIPDGRWRKMSTLKQQEWYERHRKPLSANNLLGGGYLRFDKRKKTKQDGRTTSILHNVEIKKIEMLLESFL